MALSPFTSVTPVQRVEPTGESPAPSTVNPAPSNHLAAAPPPPQPPAPVKVKTQPKVILSVRNDPIGLNVSDFLPVSPNLVNATELICGFGSIIVVLGLFV